MQKSIAVFLIALGVASAMIPLPGSEASVYWSWFKREFGKNYSPVEEEARFRIFENNVELIHHLNAQDDSASYGITQFADLTHEEFAQFYLNGGKDIHVVRGDHHNYQDICPETSDVPAEIDWRDKNAVTGVKDQGSCGSCWAFSTTGHIEGAYALKHGDLKSFSEQQLVDCDHECDPEDPRSCDAGCNGGLMWNAFQYIIKNGLEEESAYPYKGRGGRCAEDPSLYVAHVSDWAHVDDAEGNEDLMRGILARNGPLPIAINANPLQFYRGGVLNPRSCNPRALNHGVLAVGFGNDGGKDFWLVKNSWGTRWGEKGYFRIIRDKGACGLDTAVSCAQVD